MLNQPISITLLVYKGILFRIISLFKMVHTYIADCECFWIDGKMHPIEICILNVDSPLDILHYRIVQPHQFPTDRKTNRFLESHFHRLPFSTEDGTKLEEVTIFPGSLIYIFSGDAKFTLFSELFPQCMVTQLPRYPGFSKISKQQNPYMHIFCPYNHSDIHCALFKVYKIYFMYKSWKLKSFII